MGYIWKIFWNIFPIIDRSLMRHKLQRHFGFLLGYCSSFCFAFFQALEKCVRWTRYSCAILWNTINLTAFLNFSDFSLNVYHSVLLFKGAVYRFELGLNSRLHLPEVHGFHQTGHEVGTDFLCSHLLCSCSVMDNTNI